MNVELCMNGLDPRGMVFKLRKRFKYLSNNFIIMHVVGIRIETIIFFLFFFFMVKGLGPQF